MSLHLLTYYVNSFAQNSSCASSQDSRMAAIPDLAGTHRGKGMYGGIMFSINGFMLLIKFLPNILGIRLSTPVTQKKEALSDSKLPEEFRVAIAKSLVDDLFAKA